MNRFLFVCLITALIGAGCGPKEEEGTSTSTSPTTAPAPVTPPAMPPPPTTPTTAPQPRVKPLRPPRTESLAQLVQQYQSLAGQVQARTDLIQDVANAAGTTAPADQVAEALGKMFQMETDQNLKIELLDELGLLEHPSALVPILGAINPGQAAEVQESAIEAADTLLSDLAFTEDPAMFEPILKATDARYPVAVRVSAISALEDLEDQRAIPVLKGFLNDHNPEVREAAQDAIDWLEE